MEKIAAMVGMEVCVINHITLTGRRGKISHIYTISSNDHENKMTFEEMENVDKVPTFEVDFNDGGPVVNSFGGFHKYYIKPITCHPSTTIDEIEKLFEI